MGDLLEGLRDYIYVFIPEMDYLIFLCTINMCFKNDMMTSKLIIQCMERVGRGATLWCDKY